MAVEEPAAVSLDRDLTACMPDAPAASGPCHEQTNAGVDGDSSQVNIWFQSADEQAEVAHTTPAISTLPLQEAVLAVMPGAYLVPGHPATTTNTSPLDVMREDEDGPPASAEPSTGIEREEQRQSAQTDVVSAYLVTEEEPTIIATPFKDKKVRFLVYGVLVTATIALIVGLSVGLPTKSKEEPPPSDALGRLVSSVVVTADQEWVYLRANRYNRTENGREIATTTGSAVVNYCQVLACMQGGCEYFNYRKEYEPGCCRGDECAASDSEKCGTWCPNRKDLCQPSFVGCTEPYCYECERGPNGEELYQFRTGVSDVKCLRTGVAIGFDDKDDNVERIYKWAIGCGVVRRGGDEMQNMATGEYWCIAFRSGDGITKTMSQLLPCQIIQLMECGCAPDDVHTLGLPLSSPDKPCKTKEDCPYLCGDSGEEESKTLCDAFPGIKWWEGENPMYENLFTKPEDNFLFVYSKATVQIDN